MKKTTKKKPSTDKQIKTILKDIDASKNADKKHEGELNRLDNKNDIQDKRIDIAQERNNLQDDTLSDIQKQLNDNSHEDRMFKADQDLRDWQQDNIAKKNKENISLNESHINEVEEDLYANSIKDEKTQLALKLLTRRVEELEESKFTIQKVFLTISGSIIASALVSLLIMYL